MDSLHNSPVNIPRGINRCVDVQNISEDPLQELQQFWNQEILHLQHEPQHQLSSSLEKQFLYDDFLTKPIPVEERRRKKISRQLTSEQNLRVVRGEELNDIPTTYLISGLDKHEIPVIGTYVDRTVLPGFRYQVRLNQTKKYLFGGQALRLRSIGPGYGKRLTFEGKSSLKNSNYFWSDNHPEGYGFILQVVSECDRFTIRDLSDSFDQSRVVEIERVAQPQRELQTTIMDDGSTVKTVHLDLWFRYIDQEASLVQRDLPNEFRLEGVATVVKPKGPSAVAQLKTISLHKNALQLLELLPIQF